VRVRVCRLIVLSCVNVNIYAYDLLFLGVGCGDAIDETRMTLPPLRQAREDDVQTITCRGVFRHVSSIPGVRLGVRGY